MQPGDLRVGTQFFQYARIPAIDIDDHVAEAGKFEIGDGTAADHGFLFIFRQIGGDDDVVVDSHRGWVAAGLFSCAANDLCRVRHALGRNERVQQHAIAMRAGESERLWPDGGEHDRRWRPFVAIRQLQHRVCSEDAFVIYRLASPEPAHDGNGVGEPRKGDWRRAEHGQVGRHGTREHQAKAPAAHRLHDIGNARGHDRVPHGGIHRPGDPHP